PGVFSSVVCSAARRMQAQAEQDSSGTGMSREIERVDTPGLAPGCDNVDRPVAIERQGATITTGRRTVVSRGL
ncbi:MAG: hypothetical protein OEW59_06265, partial [Gammaproteobacteria bacterium]|nr:hypothetical protein [Gammaproteobacteria bacterium]